MKAAIEPLGDFLYNGTKVILSKKNGVYHSEFVVWIGSDPEPSSRQIAQWTRLKVPYIEREKLTKTSFFESQLSFEMATRAVEGINQEQSKTLENELSACVAAAIGKGEPRDNCSMAYQETYQLRKAYDALITIYQEQKKEIYKLRDETIRLRYESLIIYKGDGSTELCKTSEEVIAKRKELAAYIDQLVDINERLEAAVFQSPECQNILKSAIENEQSKSV